MADLRQEIETVAPYANTDEQGTYTGAIYAEQDND